MGQIANIVVRNFYSMLRTGVLNEYVAVEPMSPYKWRQFAAMVLREEVASAVAAAARRLQYEETFNMPDAVREQLAAEAAKKKSQTIRPAMSNPALDRKLTRIRKEERFATDKSRETLELFWIILINCQHLLAHGASTRLIIHLCKYMRVNAEKINYDKVNRWLREVQMHRMATLIGSILITNFAFKKEEIPFVKKVDNKAAHLMTLALLRQQPALQERTLAYLQYAPLENVSILVRSLMTRLDAIEE